MELYRPTYGTLGLVATHRRRIVSGSEYDSLFPKPDGNNVILSGNATVFMTLDNVVDITGKTLNDTKRIAAKLKRSNTKDTLKAIFDFAYTHIQYEKDKEGVEQLRRPARAWADRKTGIDCDCFSIFVSSILTNLKIPFYFRIIKRNYSTDYTHIYVVVPKTKKFNLSTRGDYYVIDPVLDRFDKEADSITQKFDKMGSIPLEYLDGLGHTYQPSYGSTASLYGTEFNGLSDAMGEAQAINMMIKGIKQNLVNSLRMIDKQPSNGLYHKKNMKLALQYAIKNWDDPTKRDQALDVLARQDDKLMNVKAINGICGLDGLGDGLADLVFGGNTLAVGVNGQLVDGGMGGLFSKVKEAVKNVGAKVVAVAKKVNAKVVDVAKKVGKAILKFNPLSVSIRLGMLLACELNFAGMSKKMMWGYATLEQAKAKGISEDTWNRSKSALASVEKLFCKALKGDAKALRKAILGGKRGAATGLSGSIGLGNPAALAPALAFIAKVGGILKKAFAGAKKVSEVMESGKELLQANKEAGDVNSFEQANPNSTNEFDENAEYVDDSPTTQPQPAQGKSSASTSYKPSIPAPSAVNPSVIQPSQENYQNYTAPNANAQANATTTTGGSKTGLIIGGLIALVGGIALFAGGKKRKGLNGDDDDSGENLKGVKRNRRGNSGTRKNRTYTSKF